MWCVTCELCMCGVLPVSCVCVLPVSYVCVLHVSCVYVVCYM